MSIAVIRRTFRIKDNELLSRRPGAFVCFIDETRKPWEPNKFAYSYHQFLCLLCAIKDHKKDLNELGIELYVVPTSDLKKSLYDLQKSSSINHVMVDVDRDPAFWSFDASLKEVFNNTEFIETSTLAKWDDKDGKKVVSSYYDKGSAYTKVFDFFGERARKAAKNHKYFKSFEVEDSAKIQIGLPTCNLKQLIIECVEKMKQQAPPMIPRIYDCSNDGVKACLRRALVGKKKGWSKPHTSPGVPVGSKSDDDNRNTSQLSMHMAIGTLSPHVFWKELEGCPSSQSSMRGQLLWREAFHALSTNDKYWSNADSSKGGFWSKYKKDGSLRYEWKEDALKMEQWKFGKVPFADDLNQAMTALWQHGWIHHLQRHLAASAMRWHIQNFWTEGEEWFRKTLVDHDSAVNRGNWMWLMGIAIDARSRKYGIKNYVTKHLKEHPPGNISTDTTCFFDTRAAATRVPAP